MELQEKLIEYFIAGAHCGQRIGVELEHFVLKPDGQTLSYYDNGVSGILRELASDFDRVFYEGDNIIGMANDIYSLSIEPGAQLEISINPMNSVAEINAAFEDFYQKSDPVVKRHGAYLVPTPVISEDALNNTHIIPKKRYEYMDRYFQTTGTCGRYMMRGTTSAQVSLDYSDEQDFVRKYRTAYLISPLLALAAAAGDGADYLKRITIWNDVDKARTAPPPDLFDHSFGFASYADYLMHVSAIFVPHDGGYLYTGAEPISDLAERYGSDKGMIEHYLSMVFPDVRLKNYIEIRIADSMDYRSASAYGGFCAAIFYSDSAVNSILDRYDGVKIADIEAAKLDICKNGVSAQIYNRNAGEELIELIRLAEENPSFGDFTEFTKRWMQK